MANTPHPTLVHVAISVLVDYPRRTRCHSAQKLKTLVKSIQQLGLLNPIIIDQCDMILSGHLRVEAYRAMGQQSIPAYRVCHLSSDQKAVFAIAANRMVEAGRWDRQQLKLELELLVDMSCDIDLDLTGFEIPEIDGILSHEPDEDDEPPVPEPPDDPITRPGDVWRLGEHRLICGNSLEAHIWAQLMKGETASVCFADAPYNVPNEGHVTSKKHAEFAMAHGEMNQAEFISFLSQGFGLAAQHSRNGALHFLCMDHRHLRELFAACDPIYSSQQNLIVWAKTNSGLGSFYRSRHELVALYKVGSAPHINNVQLGKYGRNRCNVWNYPGANTFRKGRDQDIADHPTIKPVAMVADALLDSSNPGDICIDGFGGSGTLILAAEKTRRRARVIEISPGYCDVAIRRWEELTGQKAELEREGSSKVICLPHAQPLLLPPPAQGGSDV